MAEFQTVRGMRDYAPEKAAKKQWIEEVCKKVFERYGFVPLETPIVENFELLAKKGSSGDEIRKEIYCFKDKSGRELGLRFDLTVPLARFVAMNKDLPKPFKRYQIGPVCRYDRPGEWRYRAITQADWDIVGASGIMSDFEIIAVAIDVMKELGFKKGEFKVKINSRPQLEQVAMISGVLVESYADCFRCLDKLDKIGREGVEKELKQKDISTEILDNLDKNVKELRLKNKAPLKEINDLQSLLIKSGFADFVEFDSKLARGLEYYTGIVFEICVKGKPSIGGGGRYDKLVETYGGQKTPAVGCSLGVDRLLNSLEESIDAQKGPRVLVVPVGKELQEKALDLTQKVRALGVNASMDLNARGISKNLDYANKLGIPFVAILGEKELKAKELTLKEMGTGKERKVKLSELKKLVKLVG